MALRLALGWHAQNLEALVAYLVRCNVILLHIKIDREIIVCTTVQFSNLQTYLQNQTRLLERERAIFSFFFFFCVAIAFTTKKQWMMNMMCKLSGIFYGIYMPGRDVSVLLLFLPRRKEPSLPFRTTFFENFCFYKAIAL